MKKNTFLFIFLLFSLPLFVDDNLSIKDDQFTFITTVKGTDPSSLNEAMVFGFRGIILRLTGDSKVLNLATIKQETRKAKNYVDSDPMSYKLHISGADGFKAESLITATVMESGYDMPLSPKIY